MEHKADGLHTGPGFAYSEVTLRHMILKTSILHLKWWRVFLEHKFDTPRNSHSNQFKLLRQTALKLY
jgi:hypothetical protein